MATTTNYGWTTPDDTALVKDGASAIRSLGTSVDTTTKNLNPSTTLGDIEYRSSTANTNTRLGIGTTGQVLTVAGGVPSWATPAGGSSFAGVSAYKSANTAISNNTFTAITFNLENFDTNTYHDNSTNTSRITIPAGKAGYYSVSTTTSFAANSTGQRQVVLYKNGSLFASLSTLQATTSGADFRMLSTYVISLAVNDYIELFAYQASGAGLDIAGGQTETTFSAFLIGA
jgi:hypothetical protein